jgi:hypothetical protein
LPPYPAKSTGNALTKVGTPISDADLITNVIMGLDEYFDGVANNILFFMSFIMLLAFWDMLTLEEMKVAALHRLT